MMTMETSGLLSRLECDGECRRFEHIQAGHIRAQQLNQAEANNVVVISDENGAGEAAQRAAPVVGIDFDRLHCAEPICGGTRVAMFLAED